MNMSRAQTEVPDECQKKLCLAVGQISTMYYNYCAGLYAEYNAQISYLSKKKFQGLPWQYKIFYHIHNRSYKESVKEIST